TAVRGGQGPGQVHDRGLGEAVRGGGGGGPERGRRRGVEDDAAVARAHARHGGAAAVPDARDADAPDLFEVLVGGVGVQVAAGDHTGVVDRDVAAAEAVHGG